VLHGVNHPKTDLVAQAAATPRRSVLTVACNRPTSAFDPKRTFGDFVPSSQTALCLKVES